MTESSRHSWNSVELLAKFDNSDGKLKGSLTNIITIFGHTQLLVFAVERAEQIRNFCLFTFAFLLLQVALAHTPSRPGTNACRKCDYDRTGVVDSKSNPPNFADCLLPTRLSCRRLIGRRESVRAFQPT